jgi:tRNA-dihydrouridine synthase B
MGHTLLSSPLQGFTDFRFRNAFNQYFGGIDVFYAPYIRPNGKLEIKAANSRDILPKNNPGLELTPQIITKDADEFLFVAKYVQSLGYKELNWNLGCPYPMVAKKGMGSGLIKDVTKIDQILHKVHEESDIIVSIKMRLGYEKNTEILDVLPMLEKHPIKSIAIHPRIGKQLYKGEVDLDLFQTCIENTGHKIYYNGDINSVADFNALTDRFPTIDHWMIGRGLIADPFLPAMIKKKTMAYPENRIEVFSKFHDTLFDEYGQALSGPSHLLMKMQHFWEYFKRPFPNAHKEYKKIKKAKSIRAYDLAVKTFLKHESHGNFA